jgi:hypothetical protein
MALPKPLKLIAALLAGSAGLILAQQWSVRAQDTDAIGVAPREARVVAGHAEVASPVPAAGTNSASPAAGTSSEPGRDSAVASGTVASRAPSKSTPATAPDRAQALLATGSRAFAVHRWLPPAPPPPAAPVAPPLPFVFVGMLEKGLEQRPQAFLAKGETLLVVGAGDLLDNKSYRIETLSPQEIVMTYLPLDTRQTLPVAGGTK